MFKTRREVTARYNELQAAIDRFTEAAAELRGRTAVKEADAFIAEYSPALSAATELLSGLKASRLIQVPFRIKNLDDATEEIKDMRRKLDSLESDLRSLLEIAATWPEKIFEMSEDGWNVTAFEETSERLGRLVHEGLELVCANQLIGGYDKHASAVRIVGSGDDPAICAEILEDVRRYVADQGRSEAYAESHVRICQLLDDFFRMYGPSFEPWLSLRMRLMACWTPEKFADSISDLRVYANSTPSVTSMAKALSLVVFCREEEGAIGHLAEEVVRLEARLYVQVIDLHEVVRSLQSDIATLYAEMLQRRLGPQSAAYARLSEIQSEARGLVKLISTHKVTDAKGFRNDLALLRQRVVAAGNGSAYASNRYGLMKGVAHGVILSALAFLVAEVMIAILW